MWKDEHQDKTSFEKEAWGDYSNPPDVSAKTEVLFLKYAHNCRTLESF